MKTRTEQLETYEYMDGLINIKDDQTLNDTTKNIYNTLIQEGFTRQDIHDYLIQKALLHFLNL